MTRLWLGDTLAAEKSEEGEEVEMRGRLAGKGTAPGGLAPPRRAAPGKNGGLEPAAAAELRASEAAAVWR